MAFFSSAGVLELKIMAVSNGGIHSSLGNTREVALALFAPDGEVNSKKFAILIYISTDFTPKATESTKLFLLYSPGN